MSNHTFLFKGMSTPPPAEQLVRPNSPRSASQSTVIHTPPSGPSRHSKEYSAHAHFAPDVVSHYGSGGPQTLELYHHGPPQNTPNASRLDMASSVGVPGVEEGLEPGVTTIHAGSKARAFTIHTELLRKRSPYFAALLPLTLERPSTEPMCFPDLDESAFALFVRWLYGDVLHGPTDFDSMNQYLGLYILGLHFRIERLRNTVIDLIREYYNLQKLTAPPYRLDYIYAHTSEPCHMRNFLITTAAYRTLCSKESKPSQVLLDVIAKGGDLAVDFCSAMASLSANGLVDVRRSPDCLFHDHAETPRCKGGRSLEPYQHV